MGQLARLAGGWPAGEVDLAVEPDCADAGGVRATIWAHRAKNGVFDKDARGEDGLWPAPRQGLVAVDVAVLSFNRCSLGHKIDPFFAVYEDLERNNPTTEGIKRLF